MSTVVKWRSTALKLRSCQVPTNKQIKMVLEQQSLRWLQTAPQYNLTKLLANRNTGNIGADAFRQKWTTQMIHRLELAKSEDVDNSNHSAAVTAIDVDAAEGRFLLAGAGNGTLYIHDLMNLSGTPRYTCSVALHIGKSHSQAHKHSVDTATWFNDTGMFLTSGRDGLLKVWDTNSGVVADQFHLGDVIHRHSNQGSLVATATTSSHVRVVDLKSGSTSHELRGHNKEVSTCVWSQSDGNYLASGGTDNKVILWDMRQARSFVRYFDFNQVRWKRRGEMKLAGMSHQAAVAGLVFAPCGRYIVSVGGDKKIRKWDLVTGNNLKTKFPALIKKVLPNNIECSAGGTADVVFVPDGYHTCNYVKKLDIQTGLEVDGTMLGHVGQVNCCKYSEVNLALYSGGMDRNVLVWRPGGSWKTLWEDQQREDGHVESVDIRRDTWSSDED